MWIFLKWRWASLAPTEDASCPFNSFHSFLFVKTAASRFPQGVAATACSIIGVTPKCTPRSGVPYCGEVKFLFLLILYTEAPWSLHPCSPRICHLFAAASVSSTVMTTEPWTPGALTEPERPLSIQLSPACCLPRGRPVRPHHEASLSSSFGCTPRRADQSWGWGESRWGSLLPPPLQVVSGWPPAKGLSSREVALFPTSLLHLCASKTLSSLNSAGGNGSLAFISPVWTHGFHTACSYSCLKTKQKLHKHLPQTPPEIILIRGCHLFPQGHRPAVSLLKKQSAFRSRRETFHWKLNLRAIDPSVGDAPLPVSYLVWFQFSSVQSLSCVPMDSLWPHGLQHARPPCPSPVPGVYSNSCPLSRWCHPTVEEVTHLKRPWCWERLKAGGDGADRGWDGLVYNP